MNRPATRYIYVDTENIPTTSWVPYLDKLTTFDTLYLFCSKNSAKVSIEEIPALLNCKATIEVVPVVNGTPNALDFVLVTVLARKSYTAKRSIHWIISDDKGYNVAIDFIVAQGVCAGKSNTMSNVRKTLPKTQVEPANAATNKDEQEV